MTGEALHLRYQKLEAEYYYGYKSPFFVRAHANDGHVYVVTETEVQRCRCAGWQRHRREYIEDDTKYCHDAWTGPGDGIAFVTSAEWRIG